MKVVRFLGSMYLNIALVLVMLLFNVSSSQAQFLNKVNRDINDYSRIKLKNGAKYYGTELFSSESTLMQMRLSTGDTISFPREQVRQFLRPIEDLIVRNDHKFVYTNYFGVDYRIISSGLGVTRLLEMNSYFLNNFRLSLFVGGYTEFNDFIGFGVFGSSLRYYFPKTKKYRPFLSVLHLRSRRNQRNQLFNPILNRTFNKLGLINIGGGIDIFSRKNIKFDIGVGSSFRYRDSRQELTDLSGNPVLFEKRTLGVSYYVEFGMKFRITSNDIF